jgi:hypothetical protein
MLGFAFDALDQAAAAIRTNSRAARKSSGAALLFLSESMD